MKTLVFDIWGEWAHFKVNYTTSSPITYSVPPPTVIFGILGAILGIEKENNLYQKILTDAGTLVSVGINKPITKFRMGLNLIYTKSNKYFLLLNTKSQSPRTQVFTEFIKDCSYKIFVSMKDENLFNELIDRVKNRRNFYTLSLGLSELIANFGNCSVLDSSKIENNTRFIDMDTIIPIYSLNDASNIDLTKTHYHLKKELLPVQMNTNREVLDYQQYLFDLNFTGNKEDRINAKPTSFWSDGNYNFIFLNELFYK
jgi:CRISPR-associated protein Cas5h